jgi:hypothetical protein
MEPPEEAAVNDLRNVTYAPKWVELEAWHAGFGHHKRPAPACRTSPRGASTLAIIAALHAARCALIVAPETFTTANRELIIALAAHHRLPAIYGLRPFPLSGQLNRFV